MTVKYEKFLLNGVEYKTQLTQKWVNRKKWEEPNQQTELFGIWVQNKAYSCILYK